MPDQLFRNEMECVACFRFLPWNCMWKDCGGETIYSILPAYAFYGTTFSSNHLVWNKSDPQTFFNCQWYLRLSKKYKFEKQARLSRATLESWVFNYNKSLVDTSLQWKLEWVCRRFNLHECQSLLGGTLPKNFLFLIFRKSLKIIGD